MESLVMFFVDMGQPIPFNPTDVAFTMNLYLLIVFPADWRSRYSDSNPISCANLTSSSALSRVLFVIVILRTFSLLNPAMIALAAPPAPINKISESLELIFLFFMGSKNPSMSVLYPLRYPFSLTTVFVAPASLHSLSDSSRNFIMSTLWGIVTLNPDMPIFFSASIPYYNSPFGILYAIYAQSRPKNKKAALWSAGENE